jgi:hypothetical protein
MKEYICYDCGKIFDRKSNYDNHKNRIKPCKNETEIDAKIDNNYDNLSQNEKDALNNFNVDAKKIQESSKNGECAYCGKKYSNKSNVIFHIKNNCKKVKEIEDAKYKIFLKLKEEELARLKFKEMENTKIQILEEENKKMKQETQKMKQKTDQLEKAFTKLQKELKRSTSCKNTISKSNINSNINSNNNNNNVLNQQNIVLVGYKKEDMENIDQNEILAIMKRGFQAPVELTRAVHFNPKYPEYHNIFIPKINEKYGMIYMDGNWKIIDKNELVEDIYENKRDFIIQNLDKFIEQLDEFKKKSLKRWLNTDDDDISIKNTKNDIKMLLYNNRKMAMEKKKIMEREARKKIEVVRFPKKIKEVSENESDSDSESDSESNFDNKESSSYDTSSEYSNYSYESLHSNAK